MLSCDDRQEDHLEELSIHLNKKFEDLKNDLGNIGENKLLLITSIKIIDDFFKIKKKINEKKNELENLKSKFLEIKKLVYAYKDDKEKEINCLLNNHEDLKSEIDKTKLNYEKILDEATSEIDKFIEKVNQDNSVQ